MAVKSCWAISRRGSSSKNVIKLTEMNHEGAHMQYHHCMIC